MNLNDWRWLRSACVSIDCTASRVVLLLSTRWREGEEES
jgi:hypothetical protein